MSHASVLSMVSSESLARRRLRPSHAHVRSTTHRRGSRTKPLAASERLTISSVQVPILSSACVSFGPSQPPSANTWRNQEKAEPELDNSLTRVPTSPQPSHSHNPFHPKSDGRPKAEVPMTLPTIRDTRRRTNSASTSRSRPNLLELQRVAANGRARYGVRRGTAPGSRSSRHDQGVGPRVDPIAWARRSAGSRRTPPGEGCVCSARAGPA